MKRGSTSAGRTTSGRCGTRGEWMSYPVDMDIPTPSLVIDAAVLRRNLDKLAGYCKQRNIGLRPHTKTHKSRRLSAMQMERGAVGLTVAKVGEAETMADVGNDILLAYPAVDAVRCERLAALSEHATVRVAVDSRTAVESLSHAASGVGAEIGILVDLDVGFGRTGLQTVEQSVE